MPNAGAKYNRQIKIQQQVQTEDAGGGYALDWTDYYAAFAQVQYEKSYERTVALQPTSIQRVMFTLRWPMQHAIDESMRVLYRGKAHNITDVTNTDDGEREMILTTELQPGNPGG